MNAKMLPSGNWRCRAFLGTDESGKNHYKSFTAPTKKQAELMARDYMAAHPTITDGALTVGQCIDKYIQIQEAVLDASTIQGYKNMRKVMFKELVKMKLSKVDNIVLRKAVTDEMLVLKPNGKPLAPKTIHNRYGLLSSSIRMFDKNIDTDVSLPRIEKKIIDLPTPDVIFAAVKDSSIELPVMLAMWLSFSMSEILGLKHSSIHGDFIQIDQVKMKMGTTIIEKNLAKVDTRTRRHRIPAYIKGLLEQVPADQEYIVDMTASTIYGRFETALKSAGIPLIAFHKLRHINASTMALLNIPDKYAQERGGWSTDATMKTVYMHTFSKARRAFDDKIDNYFNEVLGLKEVTPYEKFLNEYKLQDSDDAKELFEKLQEMSSKNF